MSSNKKPYLIDCMKATFIFVCATILSYFLYKLTATSNTVFMMYLLSTVLIARVTEGYVYGIVSSILSVIASNFVFYYSLHTIDFAKNYHSLTYLGLLLISIITSTTTTHLKKHMRQAFIREEKTKKLLEINEKLLTTRGLNNIVELALEFLSTFTDRTVIFYEGDSQSGKKRAIKSKKEEHSRILSSYHETFIAHWVYEHGEYAGAGTPRCSKSSATYFPITAHDNNLGVIGIFCENQNFLESETITFIKLVISQIAMALERQSLSDNQRLLAIETEKEKMRSNLLRAVSHDLRTPLTGMIGASTLLIENKDNFSEEESDALLKQMREDSHWLLHVVENLLSVTKLHENTSSVTKTPEPLEEVMSEVIGRIKKRYTKAKIKVSIPDELIMVPMDATLIEQVLFNLIENSIKYSQSTTPVELLSYIEKANILILVKDHGIGLNEDEIDTIFDGYPLNRTQRVDSSKGMGIGLSICKTIINAHGGTITAQNHNDGGALFTFSLPLEGEPANEQ